MKPRKQFVAVLIGAVLVTGSAQLLADSSQDYSYGAGMMGGAGPMGPGMMSGYGSDNVSGDHEPKLNDSAAQAFSANCSQCHALPDPAQHTAQEWPQTVARMKQYELAQGRTVPDETATKAIVAFLREHGRR